jgi:adenosylhomocysteine nucleosidase
MEPNIVVLISANTEWQVLRELLPDVDINHSPYGEWFLYSVGESLTKTAQPIIFFFEGWGKIAAAGATQYAIDQWNPELLINLGTCGGFAGEIEKYAIILVEQTLVYDIVEQMGDQEAHITHYTTEIDLSWLNEPYPQQVTRTLLISADRDLIVGDIPFLKKQYAAVAGDWESGAIAWVAARNRVPCLILRGVTDLVGGEGGEAYDGNIEVFVEGTRKVLGDLLAALPGWLDLFKETISDRCG